MCWLKNATELNYLKIPLMPVILENMGNDPKGK